MRMGFEVCMAGVPTCREVDCNRETMEEWNWEKDNDIRTPELRVTNEESGGTMT